VIELENVSKTYISLFRSRRVEALAGLTLSVARGEVFGIAGPNGAGKSTMLSILLGYLRPTAGQARLDGHHPRRYVEQSGVSYLTELVSIPPRWNLESALFRYAALSNLPRHVARERVALAMETLGLAEHRKKQVRQLSKGNLQRLGIAQALLADSDLVIFDEPTHGLDPVWTQKFRDIVTELRRPSRTILIASHNLDELERLADRVGIMSQGRLQRIVTAGGAHTGGAYRLVLAQPVPGLAEAFADAITVEGRANEYRVSGTLEELNERLGRLLASGATIAAFYPEQSRLETEFRAAVKDSGP
jgi:ABC-type multidrug transport system ATPase subunit